MSLYQNDYFTEGIFTTDYTAMADAIYKTYNPKTVIEFGCGPGHFTRALSKLNVAIEAMDGFSTPDFSDFKNITFTKVDLNDEKAVSAFLSGKKADMAICTEVAEHLDPASSEHLIKHLTSCVPVVIFSAAVPEQNGHGHINCRTRGFWHELFVKNNFQVVDSIRKQLRNNDNVALWYKLNLLDYATENSRPINKNETIENLVESESYSSSLFYKMNNENGKNVAYLNYPLVKQYFQVRNSLKRIVKK